jgi:signal transduction histidine kinase
MPQLLSQNDEAGRLTALQSYDLFDTGEDEDFDAITSLAAAICQIPIALITFIDDKRQWFKSHHGTDMTENSRELSFCTHLIDSGDDVMVVPDPAVDERFMNNPVINGATKLAFYAGVPLVNEDGYALGTLCVLDHEKHTLSTQQIEALKTLAKQVVDKIELRRKVLALEKVNQELLNSNVLIQKFASMAAHDIKNPLSSIALTSQALKIRLEKIQDEGCLRLVDLNITSTKNLLGLVDEMLEYSKAPSLLIAKRQQTDLRSLLRRTVAMLTVPENIEIILPEENHTLNISIIAVEQIMLNLISNAIRYNNKEQGFVRIRFMQDEDFYRFEVEDNGIGIAEQHHEKIFSNNFTLKITDRYNKKGSGIGLSTVKDLLSMLNGNISVQSVPGEGTTFFVVLKK